MIVEDQENITTSPLPVMFRCPSPCNESWSSYLFMLEHVQNGHPDLYWIEGDDE